MIGWREVQGWFSEDEARVLQDVVRRAPAGTMVVELGSWCGRSFTAIAEALPADVHATAVDNHAQNSQAEVAAREDPRTIALTAATAKAQLQTIVGALKKEGYPVSFIPMDSVSAAKLFAGSQRPVSVLFIDDHHSPDQLKKNFQAWSPHLAEACTLVLHDYGSESIYGLQAASRELGFFEPPWKFLGYGQFGSMGIFTREHR